MTAWTHLIGCLVTCMLLTQYESCNLPKHIAFFTAWLELLSYILRTFTAYNVFVFGWTVTQKGDSRILGELVEKIQIYIFRDYNGITFIYCEKLHSDVLNEFVLPRVVTKILV